jgi:hypothetical protein
MAKSRESRAKQSRPPEPQLSRVVEGYGEVSAHPTDEMLRQWGRGELLPEQANGEVSAHPTDEMLRQWGRGELCCQSSYRTPDAAPRNGARPA